MIEDAGERTASPEDPPSVARFGRSLVVAGGLSTLVLWVLWLHLPGIEPGLDDVTTSEITARGYPKGSDYVIAVIVTLTAGGCAAATWGRSSVTPPHAASSHGCGLLNRVLFVAVAASIAVAAAATATGEGAAETYRLFSGPFRWGTFADPGSVWSRMAATAAFGWLAARLINDAYHRPGAVTTPSFWAPPILAFYAALVVGTLGALAARAGELGLGPSQAVATAAVTAVAALELARLSRHETVARATSAVQLGVPVVLALPFLHTARVDGSTVLIGGARPAAAALLVVAFVTAVQARGLRRQGPQGLDWRRLVTPVTTGVVAVAAMAGFVPAANGLAISDAFHTGEQLVQWQQLSQHGRIPFVDFMPVPGGWATLVGALAANLWGSTVAGFSYATGLGLAVVAFLCGVLLHGAVGPPWALPAAYTLGTFGLPQMDRYLLVSAYVLVLIWPPLVRRPHLWLLAWIPLSILGVAAMPATVSPAVAASVPVAGWIAARTLGGRGRKRWTRYELVAAGALLVLGVALIPYGLVIAEAVLREGSANATVWGLGLRDGPGTLVRKLGFDAGRLAAWTFGTATFVALGRFLRASRRGRAHPAPSSSEVLIVLGLGYVVLSIPYAWGRIDPGALTRAGETTVLVTVFMVTWALLSVPDRRLRRRAGGGWLLVTVAAIGVWGPLSPPAVLASASTSRAIAGHGVRPNWSDAAGPGLGYYEPDVAAKLELFRAVLDRVIADGTYYDAVDRSALFAVTGRRIIGSYPSAVYAASTAAQRSVVAAFETTPPAAVVIAPAQRLLGDEVPFSLRSYRPYRWLIERGYVGVSGNGYLFLLPDDRRDTILRSALDGKARAQDRLLVPVTDGGVADELRPTDLGMAAATWGASAGRILSKMTPELVLTGRPTASGTHFAVPALEGPVPDFLTIRMACSIPDAEARYRTSESPNDWVTFGANDGQHILPLGSDPRWLRVGSSARWVVVDAPAGCGVQTPSTLYRLVE